jgi:tetratricopeptide (TPR) repeat protein
MTMIEPGNKMRRRGAAAHGALAVLALIGAAGLASASPVVPVLQQPSRNMALLQAIAQASDSGDCPTVVRLGAPLIDAAEPTGLPSEAEALIYEMVANCEWATKAEDRAYAHALRGSALFGSNDGLWRTRLALELATKRYDAAVTTAEAMAQDRPAALNLFPSRWLWQLQRMLKDDGKAALRLRLVKILAADFYAPDDSSESTDSLRLLYAGLLVDKGDSAGARTAVARLSSPTPLIEASLDPRLRGFVPPGTDVRAAAEAELVRLQAAIGRHPDRLDPRIDAAGVLVQLGRPQQAATLLNEVALRIDDPAAFTDRDDKLSWWWDSLSRAYARLGRYDDAVAAFAKGAAIDEGGALNVSQVINLASLQIRFGHGDAALTTLAAFDDPKRTGSPYGEMELRWARGCARAVAGHPADAAADRAYAAAHEKDNPAALGGLLLCLGDMDGAASVLIRRLDDPDRRAAALADLSDYDDPPVALPPDPRASRLKALKARADVRAAIARAGGTARFRLQPDDL